MGEGSELIDRMARAMQESKAWPAVFRADTARALARVALGSMSYEDDMEGALLVASNKHQVEAATLAETWDTMIGALLEDATNTIDVRARRLALSNPPSGR